VKFTKMHGAGNDYIFVNGFEEKIDNPREVAREISHRHFGVGSDGLILILPSDKADFRMQIFNPDGSEAEMCGNGIRCAAKYACDNRLVTRKPITVETLAGTKIIELFSSEGRVNRARVNMGGPILERSLIPMKGPPGKVISEKLEAEGQSYFVTCVSMGNPHTVIYVDDLEHFPVENIGPAIENLPVFPKRTNVEFVQIISATEVSQRTWERGTGETLACGTGACAVCVAGVLNQRTERKITSHLPGGDLELEWTQSDDCVYMTGDAVTVFTGEWKRKGD